jgi:zinc finger protein
LREFAEGKKFPFKFIVEDPSGNSYVQNPSAPTADQYCKKTHWIRTVEDYAVMGYPADQASVEAHNDKLRL